MVPHGLVYGGSGGDLESALDAIWRYDGSSSSGSGIVKVPSICGDSGDAVVPMIHSQGLQRLLAALCVAESVPLYVPAADCQGQAVGPLLASAFKSVNGAAPADVPVVGYASEEEVVEAVLTAPEAIPSALLWGVNVDFDASLLVGPLQEAVGGGLLDRFPQAWEEFLAAKRLSPVSVVIGGTPGSGKSELAAGMCSSLGCALVDVPQAIAYVVKSCGAGANTSAGADALDPGLHAAVVAVVEAELEKSAPPPKKGEEPVIPEVDTATFELTDAVQAAVCADASLARRCLSAFVRLAPLCRRRGYVVDCWGSGLLGTWDEVVAATTGVAVPLPAAAAAEPDEGDAVAVADAIAASDAPEAVSAEAAAAEVAEASGDTTDGADAAAALVPAGNPKQGPELFVEVQASAEGLVARLCASLGIAEGTLAKAPKDQQATVKAREDGLAAYCATLQDIPQPAVEADAAAAAAAVEGEEAKAADAEAGAVVREFEKSHEAVLQAEAASSSGCRVLRVEATTRAAGAVKAVVATGLLAAHGTVGWLSAVEAQAFVAEPVVPVEADAEAVAAKGDAEMKEGEEGDKKDTKAEVTANATLVETTLAPAPAPAPAPLEVPTGAGPQRTAARMSQTLGGASGDNRDMLVASANQLQAYLLDHVMPELAAGMVQVATDRPVDPIAFLADHLESLAKQKESAAEASARFNFDKLLAMAEGTWVEPELEVELEPSVCSADDAETEGLLEEGSLEGSIEASVE